MELTPEDIDIATRTLWGEARGEPHEGKKAVAHVILNRAHRRNRSIIVVCQQPFQFSCWNLDDPNRQKLLDLDPGSVGYRACRQAFLDAAGEEDFTEGATHYLAVQRERTPKWARDKHPHLTIAGHEFYRDIDPVPKHVHKMQQENA